MNSAVIHPLGMHVRRLALYATDPVWIAAIKRLLRSRSSLPQQPFALKCFTEQEKLPATHQEQAPQFYLLQVDPTQLLATAEWLLQRRRQATNSPTGILWQRGSSHALSSAFSGPQQADAAALLQEAGAVVTIASPREIGRLVPLIDRWGTQLDAAPLAPLAQLPLPLTARGWHAVAGHR